MKQYPTHEVFSAFQGEGRHLGRSAFFIRLFGCPVHCPWCDSAGTWHKDYVPSHIKCMTADDMLFEFSSIESKPEFVVITGGEPCIHDLDEILIEFKKRDIPVHIETSGAFKLKGVIRPDWITLSPKRYKMPDSEMLTMASEFKLIIEQANDIDFYVDHLPGHVFDMPVLPTVWLHPEWSKRADPRVLNPISRYVVRNGKPFRVGYQLHKLFGVDGLDSRTQPLAPLGGDPTKGY